MNDCFWGRIQPAVKVSDRPKAGFRPDITYGRYAVIADLQVSYLSITS